MRHILHFLTAVLLLLIAVPASGAIPGAEEEIAKLRATLATAKSPKDSVAILYNIFDLSPRGDQRAVAQELFWAAKRAGDESSCLDILRLVSNSLTDMSHYDEIMDAALKQPASKERDETILFLKMKRMAYEVRHSSEEDRKKAIVKLLSEEDKKTDDKDKDITGTSPVHAKLLRTYTLVQYLRNVSSGEMLRQYLDELIELANTPEVELYAIPNIVNIEAANIYSDAGESKKAIAVDRNMLKIIDQLDSDYSAKGRNYRNYDVSRYLIYERMMRNYKALTPDEIDDLYTKCQELASKRPEVKATVATPRFKAFYYMAKGDYNAAIPQLKEYLKTANIGTAARKLVLENLIEAAGNTGDNATKLEALTQYNTILEELNKTNEQDRYKELQIKYDVETLKAENAALELENKEDDIRSAKRIMTFVIVAFILMILVLVLALFNWRSNKVNATRLGKITDKLNRERRAIRDSIYHDGYISVPKVHDDRSENRHSWQMRMKRDKSGYNDMSIFMADSIINDLLYISSFGREMRTRFIHSVSVDSLLRKLEANINSDDDRHGVLNIEYPDKDFKIVTDSECLLTLLTHVINEALQASPIGSVGLAVKRVPDYSVNFLITIDGISGATPGDPRILEGFISKNRILEREDFGLFLCRMIMLLLGSTHYPEPSYKEGARYIFSLKESRADNSQKK